MVIRRIATRVLFGVGVLFACSEPSASDEEPASGGSSGAGTGASAGTSASAGTNASPSAGASGAMAGAAGAVATAGTGAGAGAGANAGAGTGGVAGVAAGAGASGAAGSDPAVAGTGGAAPAGETCLRGTGDFSQDGPYAVETRVVTIGSSGDFTLYVPTPLETACPHPMVAWGNGTTVPGGTAYAHFNERMASWGIVAIASHDDGQPQGEPRIGDGTFHTAAIDYLLAENENPSSEFFGKLSGRAGVSGHSQGGAGGDRASSHPAVEANGNVQGSFGGAPEGVAFLCLTGTEDIAVDSCLTSVEGATSPAMYASYDGMTHTATVSGASAGSQQYARLLSAWFRCFLADDSAACAMFEGGDACPLCQESGWDNIFSKNY